MSLLSCFRKAPALTLMLAIALAATGPEGAAQAFMKRVTLDDLVKDSDSIVVGTCTKKEVVFRDGKIVSRYQIKPNQFLKGGMKLSSAGEFTLEQQGGSIEEPLPITQMNPFSAHFRAGQELILFTEEPEAHNAQQFEGAAPEPTRGPRLVGGDHGAFSVLRNPETGDKLVLQGSTAGRVNNLDVDKLAKAEMERRRKAQDAPVRQQKPAASGSSLAGAPTPKTAAAADEAKIEPIARLDDFTAQVNGLLKKASTGN